MDKNLKLVPYEGLTNSPNFKNNDAGRHYVWTDETGAPMLTKDEKGDIGFKTYSVYFNNIEYQKQASKAAIEQKELQQDSNIIFKGLLVGFILALLIVFSLKSIGGLGCKSSYIENKPNVSENIILGYNKDIIKTNRS